METVNLNGGLPSKIQFPEIVSEDKITDSPVPSAPTIPVQKIRHSACYKFTKSFVKSAQIEFERLSKGSSTQVKITAGVFGAGFKLIPCIGKVASSSASEFVKHLDKLDRDNWILLWRHRTNDFSPSESDKFYGLFIQLGVQIFHIYQNQLNIIYRQVEYDPDGKSESQAMDILATFAGQLCFEKFTQQKTKSFNQDQFLFEALTAKEIDIAWIKRENRHLVNHLCHDMGEGKGGHQNLHVSDILRKPIPVFYAPLNGPVKEGPQKDKDGEKCDPPEMVLWVKKSCAKILKKNTKPLALTIRRPFKFEWDQFGLENNNKNCRKNDFVQVKQNFKNFDKHQFKWTDLTGQIELIHGEIRKDQLFLKDEEKLKDHFKNLADEIKGEMFVQTKKITADIRECIQNQTAELMGSNSRNNEIVERQENKLMGQQQNMPVKIAEQSPIHFGYGNLRPDILGRETFLEQLDAEMGQNRLTILAGLGGIGKTTVARQYIEIYGKNYEHVIWISAESYQGMMTQFQKLAGFIITHQPSSNLEAEDGDSSFGEKLSKIYDQLCQKETLIVFDNAESFGEIGEEENGIQFFLPPFTQNSDQKTPAVLVTARNRSEHTWRQPCLSLPPLTREEVGQIILTALKDTPLYAAVKTGRTSDTRQDAEELGKLLGCLPLAIRHATAFIKRERRRVQKSDFTIHDYINLYRKNLNHVMEYSHRSSWKDHNGARSRNKMEDSISITWNVTLLKIGENGQNGVWAIRLLNLMALLPPENIPVNYLAHLCLDDGVCGGGGGGEDCHKKNVAKRKRQECEMRDSLNDLNNWSLIDYLRIGGKKKVVSIHPQLQAVLRLKCQRQYEQDYAQLGSSLVNWERVNDCAPEMKMKIRKILQISLKILADGRNKKKKNGDDDDEDLAPFAKTVLQHFYAWPNIYKILGQKFYHEAFDTIILRKRGFLWTNLNGPRSPSGLFIFDDDKMVGSEEFENNLRGGFYFSETPQWEFIGRQNSPAKIKQESPAVVEVKEILKSLMTTTTSDDGDRNDGLDLTIVESQIGHETFDPYTLKILSGPILTDTLNHLRSFILGHAVDQKFSALFFINGTSSDTIENSFGAFLTHFTCPKMTKYDDDEQCNNKNGLTVKFRKGCRGCRPGGKCWKKLFMRQKCLLIFQNGDALTPKLLANYLPTNEEFRKNLDTTKSLLCGFASSGKNLDTENGKIFKPTVVIISGKKLEWPGWTKIDQKCVSEFTNFGQEIESHFKNTGLTHLEVEGIAQNLTASPLVLSLALDTMGWYGDSEVEVEESGSHNFVSRYLRNFAQNLEDCSKKSQKLIFGICAGPHPTWYPHLYVACKLAFEHLKLLFDGDDEGGDGDGENSRHVIFSLLLLAIFNGHVQLTKLSTRAFDMLQSFARLRVQDCGQASSLSASSGHLHDKCLALCPLVQAMVLEIFEDDLAGRDDSFVDEARQFVQTYTQYNRIHLRPKEKMLTTDFVNFDEGDGSGDGKRVCKKFFLQIKLAKIDLAYRDMFGEPWPYSCNYF